MFVFRDAEWRDCGRVLEWRNDPVTRAHSFNSEEISQAEHENWFRRSLAMTDRKLLMIELENRAIGVLRLDRVDEHRVEVSIHLSPQARNRGYGQSVLKEAPNLAKKWRPGTKGLIAKIKKENLASIKSFVRAGFQREREEGDTIWMVFNMIQLDPFGAH